MSTTDFPILKYRGNFEVTVGVDYSGSFLGADFGGGLEVTERIFPGLLTAKLSYPELSRDVMIVLPSGETMSRLDYIWTFYRERMDNGREPFLMRSPLGKRMYLWRFADESLEIRLVDLFLGSSGLSLKQAYVRGVTTLAGGALDEGLENPSTI